MAVTPDSDRNHWLIDKSALVRLAASPDVDEWANRIERGLVRITTVTLLEVGYSARSASDLRQGLHSPPVEAMPIEYATPAIEGRAVEVQSVLADRGHHRAPSIPDLLIAATAELARLVILHLDRDFDLVASITGQPVETPPNRRRQIAPGYVVATRGCLVEWVTLRLFEGIQGPGDRLCLVPALDATVAFTSRRRPLTRRDS